MPRLEIPIGTRFGRLTVVGEAEPAVQPSGKLARRLKCACDCGSTPIVRLDRLHNGKTKSCGCFMREQTRNANKTHGQSRKGGGTPNYLLWASIKNRAVTGTATMARHYLGRGITMYEPWVEDFFAFDTWMLKNLGPRPEGYSLDRIDNSGNYEPGNLRWADRLTQHNNTTTNVILECFGEVKTIAEWARESGVNYGTLWTRLFKLNWPAERAITTTAVRRGHKRAN